VAPLHPALAPLTTSYPADPRSPVKSRGGRTFQEPENHALCRVVIHTPTGAVVRYVPTGDVQNYLATTLGRNGATVTRWKGRRVAEHTVIPAAE
jgi:hypothetical protein